MPDRVTKQVKTERARRLASLEQQLRRDYFRGLLGSKLQVLVETTGDDGAGRARGTSCRYAPVELADPNAVPGTLVSAVARRVVDGPRIAAVPA
jgi:tRNA A37 methylthiotransferase MiaB